MKINVQTRKRAGKSSKSKGRKATGSVLACDEAMARPSTLVIAKPNPMQPYRSLFTRLPAMDSALRTLLANFARMQRENPGKIGPHSLTLHEDRCPFGVVLWPRASNGVDLDDMRDAVTERDAECRCHPLVMYPGATA